MIARYPVWLSFGANNLVIALSETEVAKLFMENNRSGIGSGSGKMKIAMIVNNLDFRAYELRIRSVVRLQGIGRPSGAFDTSELFFFYKQ